VVGLSLNPVLFGLPLILAPLHIAFLELIVDPTGTLVFEAEEGAAALMGQPPRRPTEPLLASRHVALSLLQGASVTAVVMGLYALVLARGMAPAAAATAAFVVLVTANAVLILPSRFAQTAGHGLLQALPRVSLWVLGGTLAALAAITLLTPWQGLSVCAAARLAAVRRTRWAVHRPCSSATSAGCGGTGFSGADSSTKCTV
jgi:Ca2+-transporting ATPase